MRYCTALCVCCDRWLAAKTSTDFNKHMQQQNGSGYVNFDAAAGTLNLVVQPNKRSDTQTTSAVKYVTTLICTLSE
jgi:hypothetical protein